MGKRLGWITFLSTLLVSFMLPALAFAQEASTAAEPTGVGALGKPLGAALAIGLSALGAGWAQSKIGAAGQGTLAERPEERIFVLTLTALPEIIVLLGFVMAILIANG